MARNLTGQVGVCPTVSYDPGLSVGTESFQWPNVNPWIYTLGTAAGQLNLVAISSGSAAASPVSIDLTSLTDPSGAAVNFAKIRAALILNDSTTDGSFLLLDNTVTNGWGSPFNNITTAKLKIPAGATVNGTNYPGFFMICGPNTTGLTVDSTHKIVSLDPGANTIPYRILWLGA